MSNAAVIQTWQQRNYETRATQINPTHTHTYSYLCPHSIILEEVGGISYTRAKHIGQSSGGRAGQ